MMNNSLCALVLVLVLSVSMASCGGSDAKNDPPESGESEERTVNVSVTEIRPAPFGETITLTGVVKAVDDVMISSEEAGVVREWIIEKGGAVGKGQIIALLNDDVVKPAYEAAAAQYNLTELNFSKQMKVYEEQAVSELQFKSSQYTRDAAKAQADLAHARLERTRLRSPVDGILDDRYVDAGEFAPSGVPIARVVNISSVKVVINVPERHAGTIARGTPVSMEVVAYPGMIFTGRIGFVGASLSPDNKSYPVELVIPNPGQRLKPEMVARAKITQSARRDAILINNDIVQQVDQGKYLVYIEKDGRASERLISIGAREGALVEIIDGLQPGDLLITVGYQSLVDGQRVSVVK